MRRLVRSSFLPGLAGLAIVACGGGGEKADPAAAQARITSTVPGLVDQTNDGFVAVGDSTIWTSFETSMGSMNDAFPSLPFAFPFAPVEEPAPPPAPKRPVLALPGEETAGEAFARFLREQVFTAENYEGEGVYRLRGEDFCGEDELGNPDAECIADFDAAEIRVSAELAGDGLDITILIGPDRSDPLSIELRSNSAALVLDLGETKAALVHLASIAGETLDLPTIMEGVIAVSLTVNGAQDVTLAGAVRESVRVQGVFADGKTYAFSTAAADPFASLRVEGVARRLTLTYDVGATSLSLPWSELDAESLVTGQMNLDWKGGSATVLLDGVAGSIAIADIGFGDGQSTLKLDDEVLFALDLNPSSGRHFDLSIEESPGALPIFGFEPEMDLSLRYHLAPLAAAGEVVESYLLDETYRIALTGTSPAVQPIAADPVSGLGGALKVVAGQLSISSTAAASPVAVSAGACLLEDVVDVGEHPILGALTSGACP